MRRRLTPSSRICERVRAQALGRADKIPGGVGRERPVGDALEEELVLPAPEEFRPHADAFRRGGRATGAVTGTGTFIKDTGQVRRKRGREYSCWPARSQRRRGAGGAGISKG